MAIFTLGCKVNQYDGESIRQQFQIAGFTTVDFSQQADIYLINSCAVTNEAARKSRQMVRRARRRNPAGLVVLTGCYPQAVETLGADADRDRDLIRQLPVDMICGMNQRDEVVDLCTRLLRSEGEDEIAGDISRLCSPPEDRQWWPRKSLDEFSGGQRAFVKIQEGCDKFCAYCIIPHARGPLCSRPMHRIVEEVKNLLDAGHLEIVLTGIHLAAYGQDSDTRDSLTRLVRRLGSIQGCWRLRLSSLEPMDISEKLFACLGRQARVAHHLHLPLQSGSDRILRRMRRPYSTDEFYRLVQSARESMGRLGLTTDVMVGFPGETEADHRKSLRFVQNMSFSRMHVFPFSARPGTRAHHMDDRVDHATIDRRRDEMLELARETAGRFHRQEVGRRARVLLEQRIDDISRLPASLSSQAGPPQGDIYFGYTGNYIPTWVKIDSCQEVSEGQMVQVKLQTWADDGCWAVFVNRCV